MMESESIIALRMERQFLTRRANEKEYEDLYRDTQPGQSVYWQGFGDPPTITFRADFDDKEYNRRRQYDRRLIKGRFQGGNLGWITAPDLEVFAALYSKPLTKFSPNQQTLWDLLAREGPMNIQLMKEMTGLLVKAITPALHRLQEAFLIYEDQFDGEWDRAWYPFTEMFPDANLAKYTRQEALCALLPGFAYRHVAIDAQMVKSFYKLPDKLIASALQALVESGVFARQDDYFLRPEDIVLLKDPTSPLPPSVFALHRNDFLVKSNGHWLKDQFHHEEYDLLQYLLIDGSFCGAVFGHIKNGPFILEDVVINLPQETILKRKDEILQAVYLVNGTTHLLKRYNGNLL